MAEAPTLKRIVPTPDTSQVIWMPDIGPLYLEDIEAIHQILSRVAKGHPFNESRRRTFELQQERYQEIQQEYDRARETDAAVKPPEPPEDLKLEPVVTMESDEFEIGSLELLQDIPYDTLPKFRISTWQPRIWVSVNPGRCYLSVNENDTETLGAFNEILAIIRRRRTRWMSFINMSLKTYMYLAGALLIVGLILIFSLQNPYLTWSLISVQILYLLFVMTESVYLRKRRPAVITLHKRDAPDFWQRNGDKIIVGTVIAIVGAITTVLLTLFVVGL